MREERLWLLLSLKLSEEASQEELAELAALMLEFPDLALRAHMMESMWSFSHKEASAKEKEVAFNRHMQRLSVHLSEPILKYEGSSAVPIEAGEIKSKLSFMRKALAWAAATAILITTGWFLFNSGNHQPEILTSPSNAQNTVTTRKGSQSKLQLPDGTQVWLNADSKITYSENFQNAVREVQLSGEAFFDVTRDEMRPFIIHTKVLDVKVLGTTFNVRSYPNEKITETSLIKGSVEIRLRNSLDTKFTMEPNDKVTVNNGEALAKRQPVEKTDLQSRQTTLLTVSKVRYNYQDSGVLETSWIRNRLAFVKEPLEEVALEIERRYDVIVTIADEKLKKGEYTSNFKEESLNEVMKALQLTGKFRYSINKKEVIIRP